MSSGRSASASGSAAGSRAETLGEAEPRLPFAETMAVVRARSELADEGGDAAMRTRVSSAGQSRRGSAAGDLSETLDSRTAMIVDGPSLPRRVGRFAILRRLGAGGMGTVYAAFDEELVRRVAIKVLHRVESRADGGRAMLRAEAQAMARLSHVNVVQVYELGDHEGQIFLVMEYIDGQTLSEWLGERSRDWQRIVAAFIAAGEGLAAAHRTGIIHRDFKPDNVLLDRDGVAKVADFGLARSSADGSGQIAGTPGYMSPEQFLGEPTDAQSDIFTFSVALFRALYGAAPFAGETVEAIRESVLGGHFSPALKVSGPTRLQAVLMRGMARRPEQRPATMEALLVELRAFLPIKGRWRAPIVAASLALAAVSAATVAIMIRGEGPSVAEVARVVSGAFMAGKSAEQAEWVYPTDEAAAADTAIRQIVDLEHVDGPAGEFARRQADALRVAFGSDLARLGDHYWDDDRTRPFARDFYAQTLMFQPEHVIALRRGRLTAGQLADLRAQAEASSFSADQLAAAEPLRVLADVDNVDVDAVLAGLRCGCSLGQVDGGAAASEAPTPTSTPTPTPVDEEVVIDDDTTGEAPIVEPDPPREIETPTPSPTPSSSPTPPSTAGTPIVLLEQAKGAQRGGQESEAIRLYSQALALDPDNDTALGALSDIAFERGDFREAATLAERAAVAAPRVANHQIRIGDAAFKLGRIDEAQAAYTRAIELGDARGERRLGLLEAKP